MKIDSKNTFLFIYVIIWGVLLFIAFVPFISNFTIAPTDRLYYGSDDIAIDLTGNIAHVRQGYEGEIFAFFNYTTLLPKVPTLLKMEYIIIGLIARIIQLDPAVAIIAAKIVLVGCWMFLIYNIIQQTFVRISEKTVATILVLFATTITLDSTRNLIYTLPDMHVFQRFTLGQVHYLLGGLTAIASIVFFSKSLVKKHVMRYRILCALSAFVSSIVYGPSIIIVLLSVPFYLLYRLVNILFTKQSLRMFIDELVSATSFYYLSVPGLFYVRWVVQDLWAVYRTYDLEMGNFLSFSVNDYLLIVGLTYFLSIFSISKVLRQGNTIKIFFLTWIILHPLCLLFLSSKLNLNVHRFLLIPYAVGFGILATDGILSLSSLFNKACKNISVTLFMLLLLLVVLLSSIRSYVFVYRRSFACYACYPLYSHLGYPPLELMKAIFWLRDNTDNTDVVLSHVYAGQLIPAFAGNRVYLSRWFQFINTPEFSYARIAAENFYSKRYSNLQAKKYLMDINVRYVFFGDYERGGSQIDELDYPFLEQVFRYKNTLIYKINN